MNGSIQRRLTVAINWSVARIANLDARECYEDSYALTEEFREWIVGADEHMTLLADQVLMVPNLKDQSRPSFDNGNGSEGLLEI